MVAELGICIDLLCIRHMQAVAARKKREKEQREREAAAYKEEHAAEIEAAKKAARKARAAAEQAKRKARAQRAALAVERIPDACLFFRDPPVKGECHMHTHQGVCGKISRQMPKMGRKKT